MSSNDDGERARTKGLGLHNARLFILAQKGAPGWETVLARLSADDRAVVDGVVPVGWYPLSLHLRVLRAIEGAFGTPDFSLAVKLGRFGAERDLTTIHRLFLRLFSPGFAVEKVTELWPRYHDTGRWTIEESSGTHIVGRLDGWAGSRDTIMCRNAMGYIGRCLELAGARNVAIEHTTCCALGHPACVFRAKWGQTGGR